MNKETCHIAYFCPSKSWGGLEMNQLRNAKWMHERGYDVWLFVQKDSSIHQEALKIGLNTSFVQANRKYYDLKKAFQLTKLIKEHQITHLIVRDPKDMSVCGLAKTFMFNQLYLAYFMEMQLGIPKRDLLHTLRFRKFDLWSCPLPWLKKQVEELTRFPIDRVEVIPSGLELDKFLKTKNKSSAKKQLELPEDKDYIGLVGRFDAQKGQHLLLEAFNLIKEETKANVVFLGEVTHGEYENYYADLLQFVTDHDLDNRVYFRPFREDVETFYAAIDVFVMATKMETFGMVTIEALASGCKVVGSNRGGTVEILQEGKIGWLFESGDKQDLARKLREAINDDTFLPETVQEAAKAYDFRDICKRVTSALTCK